MGIGLMISIDGIDQMHDLQRPYAGGKGSYVDVAQAVEIACSEGLKPDISITVTAQNVQGLPETIGWVLEKGLPFKPSLTQ